MKKLIAVLCLIVAGCATPMHQGATTTADPNTKYSVKDRADGFDIAVTYSSYQFIPQAETITQTCKNAVRLLAIDHARKLGRQVDVNPDAIETSLGRNPLFGMTTCEASARVSYL
jgi:Flp pilus assembly protein TadD